MLDKRYYEGYEGEGEVKIWCTNNENEDGVVIWIGFFETILEGCLSSKISPNGIIKCYFNQDGFYDDIWEMQYPCIVLKELDKFDEELLDTKNKEIIEESKEVIARLSSFIRLAVENKSRIYVEYN